MLKAYFVDKVGSFFEVLEVCAASLIYVIDAKFQGKNTIAGILHSLSTETKSVHHFAYSMTYTSLNNPQWGVSEHFNLCAQIQYMGLCMRLNLLPACELS